MRATSGFITLAAGVLAALLTPPAPAQGPGDAWLPRAPMNEPRMNPARTALPGNQVLVVGGFNNDFGAGNTAEIYDLATDTWTYTTPLPQAHAGAGAYAVPLPGGAVLYAGGAYFDGGFGAANLRIQSDAWLYYPETASWSPLPSIPGGVGTADINSNAVVTAGTVVIAGGSSDDSAATAFSTTTSRHTFVFDIASLTWSRGGDMIDPRAHTHFTLLDDGRILASGGRVEFFRQDGNDVYSNRVEAYNPATRTWSQIGTLPVTAEDTAPGAPSLVPGGRWGHVQHKLRDGRVLIAGGAYTTEGNAYNLRQSAFIFDPTPGAAEPWQQVDDLPEAAYMQIAADLPGRAGVLVAAGEIDSGAIDWPTSWIFDEASGTWTEAAPMPSIPAPDFFGLPAGTQILPSETYNLQTGFTRFPDGKIILSGGFNDEVIGNDFPTFSRRTYLYDPGAPGR
jgi:hypothetical protein